MDVMIRLLILGQNGFERVRGELIVEPLSAVPQSVIRKGCALTICGVNVDTVEWAESFVTTYPLQLDEDVFSFDFTGCTFARYVSNGQLFVAHVHTDTAFESDCKDAWIDYVNANSIIQFRMFRPESTLKNTAAGDECWGLITRECNCYTLIVRPLGGTTYRLERIREHFVEKTVFDYRPVLRHGLELTLAQQKIDDYLHRRCDLTRNNWDQFWRAVGYRDIYNRAMTPPPPPGGGSCFLL